ncbi:MFS general substrate transporter [Vararia minispora EC-137]|uniref:MFS general substrate transporter n=1 Tax=Vararia minispora EC-137 TaxID=1314806 RepID=A0ACB8Q8T1_9AGAM|nr:MFS general substrate transporter [Vararia minispora EC-137]
MPVPFQLWWGAGDGGYGWVIVAACCIIMSFSVGLTYSWGVIQASLTRSHLASDGVLSFVGSTATSLVAFAAFLNTRIIRWIGTRNAGLAAVMFLALGQILSSFSTRSVGGLFVTTGIVTGFGLSLGFMTCSALPAQYFSRRRGLANGFVYAGGGIGGAIWSLSMNALIAKVGIPWTFRVLGFITFAVGIPAAMVLKERTRRAAPSLELHLFFDWKFFLLFTGCALGTFPLLVPAFFIPLYATSLHTSTFLASLLLAVFNLSSAVGRVTFGLLCDAIGPVSSLVLALALSAVSMLAIWPVSNSLAPFVVFIILNGAGNGGFFSTVPSVVGHVYGAARVANALAMVVSGWALGYLLGAPIAGWILGAYGGSSAGRVAFRPAIYFAGSLSVVATLLILAMRQLTLRNWKVLAYI